MVSYWSLCDRQSRQVFRTLLSILAYLNNSVVWMISTHPLISKSSVPVSKHLVTVPRAPITIRITGTFMFYGFFNSLAWLRYLSFFSLSFNFSLWSAGTAQVLLFLWTIIRSGRLAEIGWSACFYKPPMNLCVSFSRMVSGLCKYHFIFLHNSQWITLPTQLCLVYTLSVILCCIRL